MSPIHGVGEGVRLRQETAVPGTLRLAWVGSGIDLRGEPFTMRLGGKVAATIEGLELTTVGVPR